MTITVEVLVIGAITGLTYAVLAAGLVLIHRSSGVINFAHGEMGAFCAAILAKLVMDNGWSWWAAFLLVVSIGALLGAAVDRVVVRRLEERPPLTMLVATIGIAQLLLVAQLLLPGVRTSGRYPSGLDATVTIGNLVLRGEHLAVLLLVPAIVLALGWMLTRTAFGTAIRASADNREAARLAGVNVRSVSTAVWVVAAALAAVTIVLINPIRGTIPGLTSVALGPGLLLRALAAALVGRMVSLPRTLLGGVAIGVLEAIAFVNTSTPGAVDMLLFVVVLGLVLVRPPHEAGGHADAALAEQATTVRRHVEGSLPRRLRWPALATLAAVALPFVITSSAQQFQLTRTLVFALAAVSVVIVTSWAGHLSLAQFALVGVGAMLTGGLVARGMSLPVAVLYATVAGALVAVVVGAPSLRVRGMFLGVTTVGFAVAARSWLLPHEVFLGNETIAFVERGELGFLDLSNQRTYYLVVLAVLVVVAGAMARFRRTGAGRRIVGVRDNEMLAEAFTISPVTVKLGTLALSGAVAGLAGALWAGLHVQFDASSFGPEESLRLVTIVVIGGLGSVWGAILGAAWVLGVPALLGSSFEVQLAASGVGVLVALLFVPGGLLQVGEILRARFGGRHAEPEPVDEDTTLPVVPTAVAVGERRAMQDVEAAAVTNALQVDDVTVRFGGLVAVDGVSFSVRTGETLGLIGTNGAGKSTLLHAIGGFVPTTSGQITILGARAEGLAPSDRALLGMARVFQDARLFPTLTVEEVLLLATEPHDPSELVPSLLGLGPARRSEAARCTSVNEVIGELGLAAYRHHPVAILSTGTRRVVELAALMIQRPRLVLLDEPTAGLAQRETEAFVPLIDRVRSELDVTLVLIEHDMPLVMSLSDRIICLESGRVIADGSPDEVRNDPRVIGSYLGTTESVIERSDSGAGVVHA